MDRDETLRKLTDAFPDGEVDVSLNHGKILLQVTVGERQAGILVTSYDDAERTIPTLRGWLEA